MVKEAIKRKSSVCNRIELEHGRYRIIAGEVGDISKAVAYLGMGGMRPIEAVEGETVEEAVTRMMEVLDAHVADLQRQRRDNIPSSGEYLSALAMLPIKIRELAVALHAVAARPDGATTTFADLERELRLTSAEAFSQLQKLGRKLGASLEYEPVSDKLDKTLLPFLAFSNVASVDDDGMPDIIFHPEFFAALKDFQQYRPSKIVVAGRR